LAAASFSTHCLMSRGKRIDTDSTSGFSIFQIPFGEPI
jgi:hypothetical protein